ncbi:G2/mitotic-specific cyclin-B isoform X1 [Drosophila grimshawi]|uniref:GH22089 n=1 Tax=Drosophila grimshawi TaxID=7222 RepID=B4J413_DROGR|nr:G2/mitotic-specific cyclin-B isoform X1 [Drosophila grimshawi]EDW02619.1 GH22089 [Drosophila grimshawi]
MAATNIKVIMDENAQEKFNHVHVKKLTVPSNEGATKRAALGDLQNRGLAREITTKDVAHKELKDVKLTTKARVDTHWKKQPLGTTNGVTKAGMPLLRSNSMRTGAIGTTTAAGRLATGTSTTMANAKVAADAANGKRKLKTLSLKHTSSTNPPVIKSHPIQRTVAVAAASKPKSIGDGEKCGNGGNTLRREDSNLSRKSLTKLRAALTKPNVAPAAATVKKEVLLPRAQLKKESNAPVQLKKETVDLARLPKLRNNVPQSTAASAKATTTVALSSRRLADVEDIDADDRENLILVSEYVNDIYDYLYEVEEQQPIYPDHLEGQSEVSYKMRAILIDWINEVHLQFHLTAETFHLAVAIIDRYLQVVKDTKRKNLQLVGVSALFIATKYEELFPPAMCDFVYITDDTYTAHEIQKMELLILKAIDNNLSRPLPIHFLRRYSKAASADDRHHAMSKYFLELASLDYNLASYKPSEIAAASLFLSLHLLNGNARAPTGFNDRHWTPTLVYYSRYSAAHLRPITRQIAKLARDAPTAKLRAIFNKYQSNKFHKIALSTELRGPLMDSIIGKK